MQLFLPVRDKAVHEEWARSCDIFEFHTDGVTSKDTVLTEASRLTQERDSRPLRGCVFCCCAIISRSFFDGGHSLILVRTVRDFGTKEHFGLMSDCVESNVHTSFFICLRVHIQKHLCILSFPSFLSFHSSPFLCLAVSLPLLLLVRVVVRAQIWSSFLQVRVEA